MHTTHHRSRPLQRKGRCPGPMLRTTLILTTLILTTPITTTPITTR